MTPMRQFENYTLVGKINEGGMGVVYQAVHRGLNRSCALKLIRTGLLASADERRRFLTEAEAAARLDHVNIVRVGRAGEFEGQWFLELELIEGGTLADRIAEGVLPSKEAAKIVERLARAIHHAHERGILHRDLKPANVLLALDGQPKLADFGLARFLEKDSDITRTIAILGTPAYMAPELASGRAREATLHADVYSLGVILFECLTGRRPFDGQTPLEILRKIQDEPTPRLLTPGLSRDLEIICLKCLEKEPARRYASAAALADDLTHWLRGEPIVARPAGIAERTLKWARRHPLKVALGVTGFLAIAGPLLVAAWYVIRELPYSATVHQIVDDDLRGVFTLEIYDAKGERCTLNFTRNHFTTGDGKLMRLAFTNVPPDWLPRLRVQIHADQAGRPDPSRSPVLTNGQTFRLKVGSFFDRAFYAAEVGWAASNLLAVAPDARMLLFPITEHQNQNQIQP